MSQNSFPYQPPGSQPPVTVSANAHSARRAAIVMYILGGLTVMAASCMGLAVIVTPLDSVIADFRRQHPEMAQQPGLDSAFKVGLIVMTILIGLVGSAFLFLAVFVWRARRGAIIGAIVLTSLTFAITLMILLKGVASGGGPDLVHAAALVLLPLVLMALAMGWLVPAARLAEPGESGRQSDQRQQDWFGPGGYGSDRGNEGKNRTKDDDERGK